MAADSKPHAVLLQAYTGANGNFYSVWEMAYGMMGIRICKLISVCPIIYEIFSEEKCNFFLNHPVLMFSNVITIALGMYGQVNRRKPAKYDECQSFQSVQCVVYHSHHIIGHLYLQVYALCVVLYWFEQTDKCNGHGICASSSLDSINGLNYML